MNRELSTATGCHCAVGVVGAVHMQHRRKLNQSKEPGTVILILRSLDGDMSSPISREQQNITLPLLINVFLHFVMFVSRVKRRRCSFNFCICFALNLPGNGEEPLDLSPVLSFSLRVVLILPAT